MKLHSDDILGGAYRIRKKIGAGSFGEIYIGKLFKVAHNDASQEYKD